MRLFRLAIAPAFAAITLAALTSASPAAPPSDRAATDEVQVRLISDSTQVAPGQTLLLALEQKIAPHWHTYWKNPGDSGQPTSIEWKLPQGATASDILWPVPKRFDVGPITNYGYEDRVVLLTEIRLPQGLTPGSTATIGAEATWLVCREECIPQQATLSLSLPVGPTAKPSLEHSALAAARAALPGPAPFAAGALCRRRAARRPGPDRELAVHRCRRRLSPRGPSGAVPAGGLGTHPACGEAPTGSRWPAVAAAHAGWR